MTEISERVIQSAEEKLIEIADAWPPKFSDEALAQRFVRLHGVAMRYVAAWSRWYIWNGARWAPDSTLDAFDRACAVCRATSSEADKTSIKLALASAKTVAAVERLTKVDRRIAATVDQWDFDPDVLNTDTQERQP